MLEWFSQFLNMMLEIDKRTCLGKAEIEYLPPVTEEYLDGFKDELKYPVPHPIRKFYTTVTSGTSISYHLFEPEIYGGASFYSPEELPEVFKKLELWGESISEDDLAGAGFQWLNSFPILHVNNGDVIALDISSESRDHPVLYLSHEDEHFLPIASNFDSFLSAWEKLFYIDPTLWFEYLDSETGLLNPQISGPFKFDEVFKEILN